MVDVPLQKLIENISLMKDEMVETLCELIRIKAIGPENGGFGEYDRAEYLTSLLKSWGFKVDRYDAPDERAKEEVRPNIVTEIKGKSENKIWIVTHLDVVPEGDLKLWNTPPFDPVIKDGKIYGRGSEDNTQPLVSSLFAAKAIKDLDLKPERTLCLAFVSDEETGSEYGIKYLIEKDIFKEGDMFIVPDAGNPDGSIIEIAEKSILWLKFIVKGKQAHASMTHIAINANREALKLMLKLDENLHQKFNKENELFVPPTSTFEPTKREKNVENINTIPGIDISYMDCRILPEYKIEEILNEVKTTISELKTSAEVKFEVLQRFESPPTSPESEIVKILKKAILKVRNIEPKPVGFGGNTCASFFRRAGYDAAVWSTVDCTAHQPNEYAVIDNMVQDSKVFALTPFIKPL